MRWVWAGAGAGVAVLLAALGWGLLHPARPSPSGLLGRPAPELVVVATGGDQIRLSELRGRPVVVNFWASWCGPCRQEEPALAAAARAHAGRVAFVGVDFRDQPAAARAYAAEAGFPYPVGPALGGVPPAFGVDAPPQTFFIDAAGRVAARFEGPLDRPTIERYLGLIGAA